LRDLVTLDGGIRMVWGYVLKNMEHAKAQAGIDLLFGIVVYTGGAVTLTCCL
jgi:hypothetical protein